ncbi:MULTISPECIES: ABC transporter substrate-binding protein [unclassified Oceanispirochaeta]|uniref:ABC transporter substrate-binding protein n=1 Tax=unclassified Oceanispirochaeta TaxID=2635722 RepID=UPI0018F31C23|nr:MULTISPECIES: ABC transporter substrate-binding protein [unclassified Oceanispirochaeta]
MKSKYKLLMILFTIVTTFIFSEGQTEKMDVDWTQSSWEEISSAARGTEVNFYMWGGSASINNWIDNVVAPALMKQHQLSLKRIPMDASVFINQLLAEKAVPRNRGSIDLIWINGENFRRAKNEGLLYGSFASILPNFALVDPQSAAYDFGTATEGFEAPYGRAQFVFEYDSARVQYPPRNFQELLEWTRNNPGLFTYPQPPDFTGSTFLRQALYATSGGYETFSEAFDKESFTIKSAPLWDYLNQIKPYLWQEGKTYPPDKARLDGLFEQGEVVFNMTYTQAEASGRIADGRYPRTIRTLVFEEGSISNTHFTSIPWNAPNAAGAMVLANFLLSPEMQYSKNIPGNWGDFTVLDTPRLGAEWQLKLKDLDLGIATLSLEELAAVAVPEISPSYVEAIEEAWYREVLR